MKVVYPIAIDELVGVIVAEAKKVLMWLAMSGTAMEGIAVVSIVNTPVIATEEGFGGSINNWNDLPPVEYTNTLLLRRLCLRKPTMIFFIPPLEQVSVVILR